jgi:hypothetical protein
MGQEVSWWRAQFTASKLLFYVLFDGLHIGLFILGWYGREISMDGTPLTVAQDQASRGPSISGSQHLDILRVVISRSWFGTVI